VLLEQRAQELTNAVEAIRLSMTEKPHDLVGVLERFVRDVVFLN